MPPPWKTTNQPIKYRILFPDRELASGAVKTYWADVPDYVERMYWFYAIPSETQANYPQQVWIERISLKVIDHAEFKVGITVKNGTGVGKCAFDIWQAMAYVPQRTILADAPKVRAATAQLALMKITQDAQVAEAEPRRPALPNSSWAKAT